MKIFISSLITGMEEFRAAAREAVQMLGHEPIMAEDFGARPQSPQVACLEGLRQSALVVLILGSGYGAKQATGISATHEEYRDAKGSRPVIAFVQEGVERPSDQAAFIKEVQTWEGGLFRGGFDSPERLKSGITRAIHEWQLSNMSGPLNPEELRQLAVNAIIEQQRERSNNQSLILSIIGGPVQAVLRPSEIERPKLAKDLLQDALFGTNAIFSTETGNKTSIEKGCLIIKQDAGVPLIKLDPQGGIVFQLQVSPQRRGLVILREHLEQEITKALQFAASILDKIDPTQRVTHMAIAAGFTEGNVVIRTREEDEANPNSYNMGFGGRESQPVFLQPPHRPRASLSYEADKLAEDFVTLLKRGAS